MQVTLTLTADQHTQLERHLFPGDGLEAAAILLCGRRAGARRHRLVVREMHPIPYDACSERSEGRVTWPTEAIVPLLDRAESEGWSVVKVHSHPTGYPQFSHIDDEGDKVLMPAIRGWIERDILHGSAIMLPEGRMFGRYLAAGIEFAAFDHINVAGDDLPFWYARALESETPAFAASHVAAFGDSTFEKLQRLHVAVIGCSGTGSPIIEQLARLGASSH